MKNFKVNAAVKVYGVGSRGYNQYDGTVENIAFDSIETFGDGSIGVQLSKKIGKLSIAKDLKTHGGTGNTWVKGKNVELPADALSVKEGGNAEEITIGGNMETHGDDVVTYRLEEGGSVGNLKVNGEIIALGKRSEKTKKE